MADWQLSEKAGADLDDITSYTTRTHGEPQARRYTGDIRRAIQNAADFPFLSRAYQTKAGRSYQRYNVGRHAVFFRETQDGIFVVRILHLMMDFDRHLGD